MSRILEFERIDAPGWNYPLTASQMKSLLRGPSGKRDWVPDVWFSDEAWAREWNGMRVHSAVIAYFYVHRERLKQYGTLHWLPISQGTARVTKRCLATSIWPKIVGAAEQLLVKKAHASQWVCFNSERIETRFYTRRTDLPPNFRIQGCGLPSPRH